jgi:hypothetical protein
MEVEATERKEMNKERIEILTQLIPAEVDIIARATNDPGFGWMFVKSCLDLRKSLPHQVSEPQLVRPYLYVRDQNGDRDAREALIIEQVIANDEVVYGDGAVHGNPKSETRTCICLLATPACWKSTIQPTVSSRRNVSSSNTNSMATTRIGSATTKTSAWHSTPTCGDRWAFFLNNVPG